MEGTAAESADPIAPPAFNPKHMKILDVAEFYADQGGGVKTYINQKLRSGARAGIDVVVVAPGPEDGEEERHGGRVIWVKGPPMPFDPRYTVLHNERRVHEILRAERADVIEGSSPWSGGWFVRRYRGPGAKSFIFHQDPVAVYAETFLDRRLERATINQLFGPFWAYLRTLSAGYDMTVTSGEWLAEKLRRFRIRNPQAVPFGIDRARFSPAHASAARRAAMLRQCGAPDDARLLMTVSRFHPEKRLDVVLDAFAEVAREQPLALVVYGQGPTERRVRAHATRIPNVSIAGYTSEPNELAEAYASADALLHGSSAETYGLVIAESLCSGTPVIVPSIGGAADLADPAWAEVYVPGDRHGCAAAIRRMLARDRDTLRHACIDEAAAKIWTMEQHFDALFATYRAQI